MSDAARRDRTRWLRDFAPLMGLMVLIFVLSSRPSPVALGDDTANFALHKSAHLLVYAALTWLWWRALSPRRDPAWPVLLTAAALAVLYGATDEVHQHFVPTRNGRIADVVLDAGGALMMVLALRRAAWLRPR